MMSFSAKSYTMLANGNTTTVDLRMNDHPEWLREEGIYLGGGETRSFLQKELLSTATFVPKTILQTLCLIWELSTFATFLLVSQTIFGTKADATSHCKLLLQTDISPDIHVPGGGDKDTREASSVAKAKSHSHLRVL